MRPERGGMATNFAVSNLQGMTVNTDGHPNSSPTPARPDLRAKDHRIGRQRANAVDRHDHGTGDWTTGSVQPHSVQRIDESPMSPKSRCVSSVMPTIRT